MSSRPIIVVAGVGNSSGTGAATARLFAQSGYDVALIARESDSLRKLAAELKTGDVDVRFTPRASVSAAFDAARAHWPNGAIRVALFNAGFALWKPFLETTPEEVTRVVDTNISAAFAFAHGALRAFEGLPLDARGKRGTLLFTGAIASSLSKEFGTQNIHVAHAVIDGGIITDVSKARRGKEWAANPDGAIKPESIAQAYLYLVNQDRSAWTWELDLRPAHEKW
ncbi:NAD-P-binding protein [Gloeopeniophorella convolvens]|nr:NAD-P-binding protein [Gloeopeniophorella convolvens]